MGAFCKCHDPGLGNPKSEGRNPKQIQIPNRPMFKTSRRSVVLVISLLMLGICFGLRISIFGFESPALGGAVQMRPGGTPGQRAENSQNTKNPTRAPKAGWPPAVPEGQDASPGGLRPGNHSIESSKGPGFVPSKGRFLARMKFSSPGMLTVGREPTENTTISLADPFQTTESYCSARGEELGLGHCCNTNTRTPRADACPANHWKQLLLHGLSIFKLCLILTRDSTGFHMRARILICETPPSGKQHPSRRSI